MRPASATLAILLAASLVAGSVPRPAHAQFTDITTPPLDDTGNAFGIAWLDFDGDGDPDLYVSNNGANRLLRNDGAAGFADVSAAPVNDAGNGKGIVAVDLDEDGDPDLYVANVGANRLFRNDGGTFVDVSAPPVDDPGNGRAAAGADFDRDADVDLYHARNIANQLFRNDGASAFADATAPPLDDAGNSLGAAWSDYDGDGDADLYVVNSLVANTLLRNDGGSFADVSASPVNDAGPGRGAAWGDYDNDGDPDLYVTNFGLANKLFRNDGGGVFADVTGPPLDDAAQSFTAAWVDHDNDGDLDLYVTNFGAANRLFRNDGGSFVNIATPPIDNAGSSRGAAWADADGDGDPDLYLGNNGANQLLRNDTSGNHWLHVALEGTDSNRSAIGARVRAVAGALEQTREVTAGSGLYTQNSLTLEFGLGSATVVDELVIEWPSGLVQTLTNVAADRVIAIVEGAVMGGDPVVCPGGSTVFVPVPLPGSIEVPIVVTDVVTAIGSFGFSLDFDPAVFTCVSVLRSDFTADWPTFDVVCDGTSASVSASVTPGRVPDDPDTLAIVTLALANPTASGSSIVTTTGFAGDIASAADCEATITLDPRGTGDVNDDGELSPGDALCSFRCLLDGVPPAECLAGTGFEMEAADPNCDGSCTASDALAIFEAYLCGDEPAHCFAASGPSCLGREAGTPITAFGERLRVGPGTIGAGASGRIPVEVQGRGVLRAFALELVPPDGARILGFERSLATESWVGFGDGAGEGGAIRLGGFDPAGTALDPLGWVRLGTLLVEATDLQSTSGRFTLVSAGDDLAEVQLEDAEIVFGGPGSPGEPRLGPGLPNPFRTEVRLELAIPAGEAREVEVSVYDITGRSVRTLHRGVVETGRRFVSWDGTNESGEPVASAIYFVRLRSEDVDFVRKIVLAR